MNKIYSKLMILLLFTASFISCNIDDDGASSEESYPVTLMFEEVGNSTLEYWKGGVLTLEDASNYRDFFDDDECLQYFDEETDVYNKSTLITFKNDADLTLNFGENSIDTKYAFENDTLKLIVDTGKFSLGVGNKEQLIIYGSLFKFKVRTGENISYGGCGGDEFHKYNFDGQFFLSAHENHSIGLENPEDMEEEDEVVFYNREYILRK